MTKIQIDTEIEPKNGAERFFAKIDWAAFTIAFAIALGIYIYTLAPSVTLEDSGEMAVACDHLGVPHPPGYPLWTMLGWVFTRIFSFVQFRGQPNPAWAVAMMSAFFGALTSALTAILVSRTGRRHLLKSATGITEKALPLLSGIAAGLAMAFAPVQWSQSVIVEVYTMNAFLVLLLLLLAGMWAEKQSNVLLFFMALVFGISSTHYFYASAVNLIILVTVIYIHDKDLFWDSMAAGLLGGGILFLLFSGFGDNLKQFTSFLSGMIKWLPGGADNLPKAIAGKYSSFLGAIIVAVLGSVICTVINYQFPRSAKNQAKAIIWGVALICLFIIGVQLSGAYQSGNRLAEAVVAKKSGYFIGAILTILLPFLLWILQSSLFPEMERKYQLSIFPFLIFACAIIGGHNFILATAFSTPIPNGAQGYQFLKIVPRSSAIFLFSLGLTTASLIWITRRKGFSEWKRVLPMGLLIIAVWLLIHMYLPWSSDRNPPMNWGYPRTMEGFKHAIFRGQYQKIEPFNPMTATGIIQTGHYFHLLFRQFTTPIALLGLLPLACWVIRFGKWKLRGVSLCLATGLLAVPFYVPVKIIENFTGQAPPDWISSIYSAFIAIISLCALAGFIAIVSGRLIGKFISSRYASAFGGYYALSTLLSIIVLIPLKSLHSETIRKVFGSKSLAGMKYSSIFRMETTIYIIQLLRFALLLAAVVGVALSLLVLIRKLLIKIWNTKIERNVAVYVASSLLAAIIVTLFLLQRAPMNLVSLFAFLKEPLSITHLIGRHAPMPDGTSVFIVGSFICLILYTTLYSVMIGSSILLVRFLHDTAYPDDTPTIGFEWETDAYFREWLLITIYAFLAWGLLFACMANIKLDVQDTFIQRVKFLSSYAIFSIWIGHGLMLVARRKLPEVLAPFRPMFCVAGLCFLIAMPAIPLLNNQYNNTIINEVGACDLNGHDFGWQFGNYQLRGAEAIIEELDPDEEPLPNPMYPEEMGPKAIFFGGTDPGRFVPTYMIFSALVRPDVFLITQNALADNTYMSVMRDLYGNDIWIPAEPDSAKAFNRYVKEVEAGIRQPNAHIKIEQGRVQVSGALGVMEINGLLAQMIFEHNNYRHDHYVEESYVLRWMYPYLTPHGLIMKINKDKTAISKDNARDDMYFWDWYIRRHLSNEKFKRDVAARKSFSKLRSSIAGLYSNRSMRQEAEHAFLEAIMLYPSTPEGNLRLVSEVYMNQGRYNDSRRTLTALKKLDAQSDKVDPLYNNIDQIEKARARVAELQTKMKANKLQLEEALELAQLFLSMGQTQAYKSITGNIIADKKLPPQFCYKVAKLHEGARMWKEMSHALDECIARIPANLPPNNLIEFVQLYIKARNIAGAAKTMQLYLKQRPNDWKAWLDLAKMQISALNQKEQALQSLNHAIQYGGNTAYQTAAKDGSLGPLLKQIRPTQNPAKGNFNRILQPGQTPGPANPFQSN